MILPFRKLASAAAPWFRLFFAALIRETHAQQEENLTDRRRPIPPKLRALILNHIGGLQGPTRYPANFFDQFVARTPNRELLDTLSRAFARADALLLQGAEILAAQLHEAAIALDLMSTHQLSLRDLAVIDVERHLERDREGHIRRIRMSAQDASSPLGIDIPLQRQFAARVGRHVTAFRPLLPGAEWSTRLFPGSKQDGFGIHEFRARLRLVELMSGRMIFRE